MVESYLARWNLGPAGAPFTTHTGTLVPVVHRGAPAMLKVSTDPGERLGGALMAWWDGDGAAGVLAAGDDAARGAVPRSRARGRGPLATIDLDVAVLASAALAAAPP
jgi:streptomycin 6-kinase